MKTKNLTIRNSTAEFLIFTSTNGQDTIEVKVKDETVWLTQKLIAKLFDVSVATINEHLKNIFKTNELEENSVIRKFLITANDGKNYKTKHYNLEVIISLGYRINSNKATEFRRWATEVLKTFAISEFEKYKVIQDKSYKSDFDRLLGEIDILKWYTPQR